jgi:hypothetical protein
MVLILFDSEMYVGDGSILLEKFLALRSRITIVEMLSP